MSESKTTTNHNEIKKWAEERNARPARVKGTDSLVRLDFPDYSGEDLEKISWDEFFDAFDKNDLALVYQEKTDEGQKSNFNKIIRRG